MKKLKSSPDSLIIRVGGNCHRFLVLVNGKFRSFTTHEKDFLFNLAALFGYLNRRYSRAGYAIRFLTALALSIMLYCPIAFALPSGWEVVSGDVTFDQQGSVLNVTSASQQAIVNYQSFNVASGETVNFNFLLSGSSILNRVVGMGSSTIAGNLTGNGSVLLVNPAGINFASSANVNVGSMIASTLGIADHDYLSGNYVFNRNGSASGVHNEGNITAGADGHVVLIGSAVQNDGTISAPQVALAVGEQVTVSVSQDLALEVTVDQALKEKVEQYQSAIANSGTISAEQSAELKAKVDAQLYQSVVNNDGLVEVTGVQIAEGGKIVLFAKGGEVANSGTLQADNGTINVTGDTVVQSGTIQAESGDINLTSTEKTTLATGSVTSTQGGESGDGGNIIVWSDGDTDFQHGATIDVSGGTTTGDGGFAEVSAVNTVFFNGQAYGSSVDGTAGSILIDPTIIRIQAGGPAGSGSVTYTDPDNGAGESIFDAASFSGFANVTLEATDDIFIETPWNLTGITAGNNLILRAGDNITIHEAITTNGGNINLHANYEFATSPANGGGEIRMYNNAALNTNGGNIVLEGYDLQLDTGSINTAGGSATMYAADDLYLTASLTTGGGAVNLYANYDTQGPTGPTGVGQVFVYAGGINSGGGNILMEGQDVESFGIIDSGTGSITARAFDDIIFNEQVITNGGDLNIYANQDLGGYAPSGTGDVSFTATGTVTTNGGNVYIEGRDVTVDQNITTSGGGITIRTADDQHINALLSSGGGAINLESNYDITGSAGPDGGGDINISALGSLNSGTGDINLAGRSGTLLGTTSSTGAGTVTGAFTNSFTVDGTISTAGSQISLTADSDLSGTGILTVNGSANIHSNGGDILLTGDRVLLEGGAGVINAGTGDLTVTGTGTNSADLVKINSAMVANLVTLISGEDIIGDHNGRGITATSGIIMNAADTIDFNLSALPNGSYTMNSLLDITADTFNLIFRDNITIQGATFNVNTMNLTTLNNGSSIVVDSAVSVTTLNANAQGTGSLISILDPVQADTINLTTLNAAGSTSAINVSNTGSLTSPNGTITLNGGVSTLNGAVNAGTGTVSATISGDITVGANITGSTVSLDAGDDVLHNSGTISATTVNLTSGDDILQTSGFINATNLNLTATGDRIGDVGARIESNASNITVTASGGTATNVYLESSANNVTLGASTTELLFDMLHTGTGTLTANNLTGGTVNLTTVGHFLTTGTVTSTAGGITINADSDMDGTGDLTYSSSSTLDSNGGNISLSGERISMNGTLITDGGNLFTNSNLNGDGAGQTDTGAGATITTSGGNWTSTGSILHIDGNGGGNTFTTVNLGGGTFSANMDNYIKIGHSTTEYAIINAGAINWIATNDIIFNHGSTSVTGSGTVNLTAGDEILMNGGTLNSLGTAMNLTSGVNRQLLISGTAGLTSSGGNISLRTDTLNLDGTVNAGAGTLNLYTRSNNRAIEIDGTDALGAAEPGGVLRISHAELHQMQAGTVRIGESDDTGGITRLDGAFSNLGAGDLNFNLSLYTGGNYTDVSTGANDINVADKTLIIDAGGTVTTRQITGTTGTIHVESGGNLTVSGDVTLTGAGDIILRNNSSGDIILNANVGGSLADVTIDGDALNGSIIQNAGIITADALDLDTDGSGSIGTAINPMEINANTLIADSDSGTIYLNETDNVTVTSSSESGTFNLNAGGAVTVAGDITSSGNVDIQSNGNLTVNGVITSTGASTINLTTATGSNGNIALNANVGGADDTVNIDADGSGNITRTTGRIIASTLNLSSDTGSIGTSGQRLRSAANNLTANTGGAGNVYLQNNSGSFNLGASSAGGVFNLNHTNSMLNVGGNVNAGSIIMETPWDITVTGNLTTTGGLINLWADNDSNNNNLTLNGTLTSNNGNIVLRGARLDVNNTINAGTGTVTGTANVSNGAINLAGNITGSTINLTAVGAGNIARTAGTLTAGTVSLTGSTGNIGTSTNRIVTATNSLTANTGGAGNVYIQNSGNPFTLGASSAGGIFDLTHSASALVVTGNISAASILLRTNYNMGISGNLTTTGGLIDLHADTDTNGGPLNINGTLTSNGGDMMLRGSVVNINNTLNAGTGDITAIANTANGTIGINGNVTGSDIILTASGAGNINRTSGILTGDSVTLTADTGNIGTSLNRIFTNTASLSANSGGASTVYITNNYTGASPTVTLNNSSGGSMFDLVNTGADLSIPGTLSADFIHVDSALNMTVSGTITADGTGTETTLLETQNGDFTLTAAGSIISTGTGGSDDISIITRGAGNPITINGTINSGRDVDLTTYGASSPINISNATIIARDEWNFITQSDGSGINITNSSLTRGGGIRWQTSGANSDIVTDAASTLSYTAPFATHDASIVQTSGANSRIELNTALTFGLRAGFTPTIETIGDGSNILLGADVTTDPTDTLIVRTQGLNSNITRSAGTLFANTIQISATQGDIGTWVDKIQIDADNVTVNGGGEAYIRDVNTSNTNLGASAVSGQFDFLHTGNSDLIVTGNVSGGGLYLESRDGLTINSGVTVSSAPGTWLFLYGNADASTGATNALTINGQLVGNGSTIDLWGTQIAINDGDGNPATFTIDAGGGTVSLKQAGNFAIEVGGAVDDADGLTTLDISSQELSRISASSVIIGETARTGGLTVEGNIDLTPLNYDLSLANGGNITATGRTTTIDDQNLTMTALGAINTGAITGTTGDITVTSGTGLTVDGAITLSGAGDITLRNNTSGNIALNANVGGALADVTIDADNNNGSITQAAGMLITADHLDLDTDSNGSIGSIGSRIQINANTLVADTDSATQGVYIHEVDDVTINLSTNSAAFNLTAGGSVTVAGTINSTGQIDIAADNNLIVNANITTTNAAINLTADADTNNTGAFTNNAQIASGGGDITLNASQMDLNAGSMINAGAGDITIQATTAKAIEVGGAAEDGDSAAVLDISNPELTRLSGNSVTIGETAKAGGLTVEGNIDLTPLNYDLTLANGGNINATGRTITNDDQNLTMTALGAVYTGSITGSTGTIDVTAGNAGLYATDDIWLTGTGTINLSTTNNGSIETAQDVGGPDATVNITANGSGSITQVGGHLYGLNLNLASGTGDIGISQLQRIYTRANNVTVNTGGSAFIHNNVYLLPPYESRPFTLGDSSAGGTFAFEHHGNTFHVTGDINAQEIELFSNWDTLLDGNLTTTGGNIQVIANGDATTFNEYLTINGILDSNGGDILLQATQLDINDGDGNPLTHTVNAGGGNVSIFNSGNYAIQVGGGTEDADNHSPMILDVSAAELARISANSLTIGETAKTGGLTVLGNIDLSSLGYDLSLNNGGNVTATGFTLTNADKTLSMTSLGTLRTGAVSATTGTVNLTGGAGSLLVDGVLDMTGVGTMNLATTNGGSISFGTDVNLPDGVLNVTADGAGAITRTGGRVSAFNLFLTSGTGNISLLTRANYIEANTGGNVNLDNSTSGVLPYSSRGFSLGPSSAGGLFQLSHNGGTPVINGDITAGSIDLRTHYAMTVNGDLTTTGGNIRLWANADGNDVMEPLQVNGTITSNGGDITLRSTQMDINNVVDAGTGTVNIFQSGDYAIFVGGSTVDADTSFVSTMDISATELGWITADSLVIGETARTGGLTVEGNIDLSALGYNLTLANGGNISNSGFTITNADQTLNITTLGTLDTGNISATTGTIDLTAGTALNVDGDILMSGVGNINLSTTSNGNITFDGNLGGTNASVDVTADGTGLISRNSGIITASSLDIASTDGDIGASLSPIFVQSPNLTANTTGDIYINNMSGDVTLGASSSGGTFSFSNTNGNLTAGGDITADSIILSSDFNLDIDGNLTTTGGLISLTANADGTLGVAESLTIDGAVNSNGGNILLNATQMDINNTVNAGSGTVTITNTAQQAIEIGGAIIDADTPTVLDISNPELDWIEADSVIIGETAKTGGITTEGNIDLSALGYDLTLNNGGDITNTGFTLTNNDHALTLNSLGTIRTGAVSGTTGTIDMTAGAGGILVNGDVLMSGTGTVNLTTTGNGDITLNHDVGGVDATVNVAVNGSGDLVQSAGYLMGLNLNLSSGTGNLGSLGNRLDLRTNNLTMNTGGAGIVHAINEISGIAPFDGRGFTLGASSAGGLFQLEHSGTHMTVSGAVDAQSLIINTSWAMTVNGDLSTTGGDIMLIANQDGNAIWEPLTLNGMINSNGGDITLRGTQMDINNTVDTGGATGTVFIQTTGNFAIEVGSTTDNGDTAAPVLDISAAELGRINAPTIHIGETARTGGLTVEGNIDLDSLNSHLILHNGGNITNNATIDYANQDVTILSLGTVNTGSMVSTRAAAGDVNVTGDAINVTGNVTLTGTGTVNLTTTNNGDIVQSGNIGGQFAVVNLNANGSGDISRTSGTLYGADINLTSGSGNIGSALLPMLMTGFAGTDSVAANTSGNVYLSSINARTLNTSTGNIFHFLSNGDITLNGNLTTTGRIDLLSDSSLLGSGNINSGGNEIHLVADYNAADGIGGMRLAGSVNSGGSDIHIGAGHRMLDQNLSVNAGAGDVYLYATRANKQIRVNMAHNGDDANVMSIEPLGLNQITAGRLYVGDNSNTGGIHLDNWDVSGAGAGNFPVTLTTRDNITQEAGAQLIADNVTFNAGGNIASVGNPFSLRTSQFDVASADSAWFDLDGATTVNAVNISGALTASGNNDLTLAGAINAQAVDIRTDGSIDLNADLTTTGGNVTLYSDTDASGGDHLNLANGSDILSSGGNIDLQVRGIGTMNLNGNTINAGAGTLNLQTLTPGLSTISVNNPSVLNSSNTTISTNRFDVLADLSVENLVSRTNQFVISNGSQITTNSAVDIASNWFMSGAGGGSIVSNNHEMAFKTFGFDISNITLDAGLSTVRLGVQQAPHTIAVGDGVTADMHVSNAELLNITAGNIEIGGATLIGPGYQGTITVGNADFSAMNANVTFSTAGTIVDGIVGTDALPNIVLAANRNLVLQGIGGGGSGQIGAPGLDDLDVVLAGTGRIDVHTNNANAYINLVNGGYVGLINVGSGGAHLTAQNGSLLDGNGAALNLIAGSHSYFSAFGQPDSTLGTFTDALEINVSNATFSVLADGARDGVSVNINGSISPVDQLSLTGTYPGMVLYNSHHLNPPSPPPPPPDPTPVIGAVSNATSNNNTSTIVPPGTGGSTTSTSGSNTTTVITVNDPSVNMDGVTSAVAVVPDSGTVHLTSSTNTVQNVSLSSNDTPQGSGSITFRLNPAQNAVTVIDPVQGTMSNIPVGEAPVDLTYNPVNGTVYVANSGDNSITVIDSNTLTTTRTVKLSMSPHSLTLSPDGQLLYVFDASRSQVIVLETTNFTVIMSGPPASGSLPIPNPESGEREEELDNISAIDSLLSFTGQARHSQSRQLTDSINRLVTSYFSA